MTLESVSHKRVIGFAHCHAKSSGWINAVMDLLSQSAEHTGYKKRNADATFQLLKIIDSKIARE
jgi:hypothetical protein